MNTTTTKEQPISIDRLAVSDAAADELKRRFAQVTAQRDELLAELNKVRQMTKTPSKELALQPEPTVAVMLQNALASIQQSNVTSEHVEVLGKMMDLYERNDKRQSEREFAEALTALQGETIRVEATKAVDVKNGVPRYTFAPYEEIMQKVQPMLTRHGFSITFDTKIDDARLTSICTLTHKAGHSRSNQFAVRFSKPPGCSDAQGDMSTKSYAKRGALCDALNIVVDHDDDARMIGKPIGRAIAEDLRARVIATGSDELAFLRFAGVCDNLTTVEDLKQETVNLYERISDERFDALDEILRRKEGKLI